MHILIGLEAFLRLGFKYEMQQRLGQCNLSSVCGMLTRLVQQLDDNKVKRFLVAQK